MDTLQSIEHNPQPSAEGGYDLCLDGHKWSGILVDKDGAYKMCLVCD